MVRPVASRTRHASKGGSLTERRRSVKESTAGTSRCVAPLAGLFFSDEAAELGVVVFPIAVIIAGVLAVPETCKKK